MVLVCYAPIVLRFQPRFHGLEDAESRLDVLSSISHYTFLVDWISETGGCRLRRRVVAVSAQWLGVGQVSRRRVVAVFGDGWLPSHTSSHTLRVDKTIRAPTQEPIKEKFSGERKRGFFLACLPLCRCVSAVCLSSCLCLGSSWPGWSGVCRVRCFVSCCFRGASFLVGAVPKTGNDTLGIPLPRARLRARLYLGYGAASLFIVIVLFALIDVEASRHFRPRRAGDAPPSAEESTWMSQSHFIDRFAQRQVHLKV